MTQPRIWTDAEAERRFWALMSRYETVRADVPPAPRLLGSLSLAGLRGRLAIIRSRRIEAQAQALLNRFTVAAAPPATVPASVPSMVPVSVVAAESAPSRTRSVLLIAATLANDGAAKTPSATERAAP